MDLEQRTTKPNDRRWFLRTAAGLAAAALLAGCGDSGLPRPEVHEFNIEGNTRRAYSFNRTAQVIHSLCLHGGGQDVLKELTQGHLRGLNEVLIYNRRHTIWPKAAGKELYWGASPMWIHRFGDNKDPEFIKEVLKSFNILNLDELWGYSVGGRFAQELLLKRHIAPVGTLFLVNSFLERAEIKNYPETDNTPLAKKVVILNSTGDPTAPIEGGYVTKTALPREVVSQEELTYFWGIRSHEVLTLSVQGEHQLTNDHVKALLPHI